MCLDAASNWICRGPFGKDTRLCVGEAASVPLIRVLGKGEALPCRALAAPALQPRMKCLERWGQREGVKLDTRKRKGRRDCEGAIDPKFTAIIAVPHHIQRQYPAFLPKTYFLPSWLLCNGQSRYWCKHSRKENVLQTCLEGIRDVLFVKGYKIA